MQSGVSRIDYMETDTTNNPNPSPTDRLKLAGLYAKTKSPLILDDYYKAVITDIETNIKAYPTAPDIYEPKKLLDSIIADIARLPIGQAGHVIVPLVKSGILDLETAYGKVIDMRRLFRNLKKLRPGDLNGKRIY